MPTRKTSNTTPITTAQSLGSLLKSARDIMRKDKGLNGDLDRLPPGRIQGLLTQGMA